MERQSLILRGKARGRLVPVEDTPTRFNAHATFQTVDTDTTCPSSPCWVSSLGRGLS